MYRAHPCLVSMMLVTACGGSQPHNAPIDAPSPWATVRSHYGRMVAVAGAGATDTRTNEWLPAYEGGAAVAAELSRPHMAMADAAGNVYIADKEGHAIRRVTTDGVIRTYAGTGAATAVDDTPGPAVERSLANPNGLFVRPDGTLYILDLDHGRIRKVTTDGTMSTLVTVPGGIPIGRGLWVDGPDGNETVYISSASVIKRWTAATGVTTWATGFVDLGNIAMDSTGTMLASDRAANRVYTIAADGAKTAIAGNGATGAGVDGAPALSTPLEGVRAVWPAFGADGGGFFAGTHEGCQLWFIDADGVAHLFLDGEKDAHAGVGDPFDTPGKKVSEMRSVTLDANGGVLFVDDDRGFVRLVERK